MEFGLLGPVEVHDEGRKLDIGSRRLRALLALLLIHANRVVSGDHILEALWGDDALGKENAMWVAVSRLRSTLEPGREDRGESSILVTRDHGYILQVDPGDLDVNHFEAAIAEARTLLHPDPQQASERIRDALRLWRGAPVEDFKFEAFARIEVARLEDLRLEALELAAEADLRLGHAREQIATLETLNEQHPLRERFVELLMRSLYQCGRQADALRLFDRHRRTVGEELGIDPSPELRRLEEQILLHDPAVQRLRDASAEVSAEAANPFKGLRAFGEEDAEDFFGRDRLVADVVRRLAGQPMVALVGASGSGKSSVARAGVIPALRKGALEGSQHWLIAQMVPGAHPLAELEASLLRCSIDAPESLAEPLADPKMGLLRAALRLLPEGSRLVLVVDQFEELFTLVEDEEERVRFLDLLGPALDDPHGRVVVLLTLRADFYDRPLQYPKFAQRLGDSIVNVSPLTADELEEAAHEPLRRAGVAVEPALLASLLTDVVGQPGALPLFQYTLTMLFDRRTDDAVTLAQYREMDGLKGALTQRAEDLYAGLNGAERDAASQLFLRLVTISGDREWSRRRVPASELVSLRSDLVSMQRAIEEFGSHRLLAFDRDHVTGSPTVEVAHEALLTEWPRLREWIDEARDDVVRHSALVAAMNEWQTAERNPDYVFAGQRLADYEAWAEQTALNLSDKEQDFLRRGIAIRDDADREEADRRDREALVGRRAKRRALGLVALILAAVGLGTWLVLATEDKGPKIALIETPASDNEGPLFAQFRNGWDQAIRDNHFEPVELTVVSDPAEVSKIIANGTELLLLDVNASNQVELFASDNPAARFVTFAEHLAELSVPNVTNVVIESGEGSYLAGAAAALTSETGTIGFLGGNTGIVDHFRAGFEAGARAVRPDVELLSTYLVSDEQSNRAFGDFNAGAVAARSLYESGADVVFHAAGFAGSQVPAVADAMSTEFGPKLWAIGVDSDQYLHVSPSEREHVLTSMLKRSDLAIGVIIERYLAGELPVGTITLSLSDGAVGYSKLGDHLSAATIGRLDQLRSAIIDGTITVPSVPAGPPTSTGEADVVTNVDFDGRECTADVLPTVPLGSSLLLRFRNTSDITASVVTHPEGWFFHTRLAAGPGAENTTVLRPETEQTWELRCTEEQGEQVGEPLEWTVQAVTDRNGRHRVVFDGDACRLEGDLGTPLSPPVVFQVANTSAELATFAWFRLGDPDLTIEQVRADPELATQTNEFIAAQDPESREELAVSPPLDPGGTYLINCVAGGFGNGGANYAAGLFSVAE